MSSHLTGTDETAGEFGANEWLVDELYEQFVADKSSVDESWWPVLESYHRTQLSSTDSTTSTAATAATAATDSTTEAPAQAAAAADAPAEQPAAVAGPSSTQQPATG